MQIAVFRLGVFSFAVSDLFCPSVKLKNAYFPEECVKWAENIKYMVVSEHGVWSNNASLNLFHYFVIA